MLPVAGAGDDAAALQRKFRQSPRAAASDLVAPYPDQDPKLREVELYEQTGWACGRISLLDFLRKTTAEGKICHWLKKQHVQSGSEATLEEFAASYLTQLRDAGRKSWPPRRSPSSTTASSVKGRCLTLPSRKPRTSACHRTSRDSSRKVTGTSPWRSSASTRWPRPCGGRREDPRGVEAHTKDHVDTILAIIHRGLLQEYLGGSLDAERSSRPKTCATASRRPRRRKRVLWMPANSIDSSSAPRLHQIRFRV